MVEERDLAIQRIHKWNALHSDEKGIVLAPLTFERNTPSRVGKSPQDTIDVVLDKADFLIGMFWSSIGSGSSEHEIVSHVKSGKSAALLFSKRDVPHDKTDGVADVKALQKRYQNQAFYHEFDSLAQFNDHIDNELHRFVMEIPKDMFDIEDAIVRKATILSENAQYVLKNMSQTKHPLRVWENQPIHNIDTGLVHIYYGRDARVFANWKDAVKELENASMIQHFMPLSDGQSYELTKLGWDTADDIPTQIKIVNDNISNSYKTGTTFEAQKEYNYLLNVIEYKFRPSKSIIGNLSDIHNILEVCFNLENLDSRNLPIKQAYVTVLTNRGQIRMDANRLIDEKGNTSELKKIIDTIKPNESRTLSIMFSESSTQIPINLLEPKIFKMELILPNEYHLEVEHSVNSLSG